jgi:NADPH-dependent 2,4-dienoyl-CoA reductase/sulfur reductase-like enzyme
LRSLADAAALRDAAETANSAVVIGSGFIGCEAAASLAMRNVAVTLVAPEALPQEKRLGFDAACASCARREHRPEAIDFALWIGCDSTFDRDRQPH